MFRTRLRAPRRLANPGLRAAAAGGPNARRSIHQVPALGHDYAQSGVPGLMSAELFKTAWTDYMALTIDKLNALTTGTELEDKDAKTIALMTAREPSQAPVFNYASMAHNTHFFFQGLAPAGARPVAMPDSLRADLEASFSSLETLRREFVITAASMFGPGFVWLVKTPDSGYRLLPTYLAGSPYPGAHWRAQPADMNTLGADGSARPYYRTHAHAAARPRAGADLPPGGVDLVPLLCINTWEHAWLGDYGVGLGGGGKLEFAERWWDVIDWDNVALRAGVNRPDFRT